MLFVLPASVWAAGFGDPDSRCGESGPTEGHRLRGELACWISEIGPRPSFSVGSRRALAHVAAAIPAPWMVDRGPLGTVIACRRAPDPRTLLLVAHVDAVHAEVPGATDNLVGVVLLVDLARRTPALKRTVCLAFPDGEEVGLVGSRALARQLARGQTFAAGLLSRPHLDLVVSVDVFGRGEPAWNGIGPGWDSPRLRHLLEAAPAQVPLVNRAISDSFPAWERSDHGPFVGAAPAAHLMSKAEGGVVWAYHTLRDDVEHVEPARLEEGARLLSGLAEAPALPAPVGGAALVLPMVGWVAPAWIVQGVTGSFCAVGAWAAALGLGERGSRRAMLVAAFVGALAAFGAGGWAMFAAGARPVGGSLAEIAVGSTVAMGGSLSLLVGPPAAAAALRVAGLLALMQGVASVVAGLPLVAPAWWCCAGACWVAAAWGRHPSVYALVVPAALAPSAFLVRPDALRELIFHGFLADDPVAVAVYLALTAAPGLLVLRAAPLTGVARRVLGVVLLAISLVIAGLGWSTSPYEAPFAPREVRWP